MKRWHLRFSIVALICAAAFTVCHPFGSWFSAGLAIGSMVAPLFVLPVLLWAVIDVVRSSESRGKRVTVGTLHFVTLATYAIPFGFWVWHFTFGQPFDS